MEPKKKILVVGDWVVDEHWATSVHRSVTRSRTGRQHSRVLHNPSSWILTLAGAGKTAELLFRAGFEVRGAGVWDVKDDGPLYRLLTLPPSEFHHFNFDTLTGVAEPGMLVNLGAAGSITTRVIRVWQQQGSRYEIVNRIDWEAENAAVSDDVCRERLPVEDEFDAIVLKDMAKGVVTSSTVQKLQNVKADNWFVSSKLWRPNWYDTLASKEHRDKVRLFLVPQVAAAAASRSGISRWFTDRDLVSLEGVTAIQQIRHDFPNALICVLPKALSIIALAKLNGTDRLFTFLHEPTEEYQTKMPMASVFLPTMAAALLRCWPDTEDGVRGRLTEILRFVDNWMHHQFTRITSPFKWLAKEERSLVVSATSVSSKETHLGRSLDVRVQTALWKTTSEEWDAAHSGRGVIGNSRIETRRAAIEVDGYVCLVKQKREVLRRLLAEIRSFDPDSGVSKSFMLLASPGSGKSYLVKKLADMEMLELLAFNITSLNSRLYLMDCFDTIVTTQAAKRGKRFLVFFDEIDAYLDGQPVYDAFLRPLEEGLYIRAGKAFHVDPCIWMFCGTRSPVKTASRSERAKKGSDFLSRLTLHLQDFGYALAESGTDELARLENVYAGVAVLKRAFPDVAHVSEAVLEAFRCLPPQTGIRQIERFVKRFSEIQYGKVTSQNLQEFPWKDEFGITSRVYQEWARLNDSLDKKLIFIDPKTETASGSSES